MGIVLSMGHRRFVLWRGATFDVQRSRLRSRQPEGTTRSVLVRSRRSSRCRRAPADLLLEQKRSLEQLNTWFEVALNNMVRGLSMFDADQRLIVCNKSYRQMYSLPEELTHPGTPLTDIVRYHVHAGNRPRRHDRGGQVLQVARRRMSPSSLRAARSRTSSICVDGRYSPRDLSAAGRRRLGRHSRGHHREAAHRGEDRMARASRCADRRRQSLPLP